jgi:hypothetical protein
MVTELNFNIKYPFHNFEHFLFISILGFGNFFKNMLSTYFTKDHMLNYISHRVFMSCFGFIAYFYACTVSTLLLDEKVSTPKRLSE